MKKNILLAFSFAKRDFKEKYVGTALGQFWFLIHPVIMIVIYTVIFSSFMKMKLNVVDNSFAYSIYLIPGILAWTTFATILTRLSISFDEKKDFIKKINIPMYTFQLSVVITEFFILVLSYILAIVFLLLVDHPVTLTFLYLLPVLFLNVLFAFGLGVIFSLFTPFIKDIKVIVPIIIQLWFWMTPIIYMKEMVMDEYPLLLVFNPVYYFTNIYQNIFLYSETPNLYSLVIIVLITSVTLLIASYLYKKMISTIKDII
ncbi:MAG: ABC transporter permease [Campylobacterales bacterium]